MKRHLIKLSLIVGIAVTSMTAVTMTHAQKAAPFGGKGDVAFAKDLWAAMEKAKLVGANAINVRPFKGNEPHGAIQQVLDTKITVRGRTARVIVKRNNGGKGVTVQSVYDDQFKDLKAITVMFKRKKGYDSDNLDWYWAKYTPKGGLAKNPKGMMLAGRVAKGASKGCIACHTVAGGADRETLTSK